ncbi:conserved hypothetical protein [Hyella patelloides LEGE 07179]|uniref:CRISPR-associated protein Cmr3 n=1 Tax=Hyella patelloides LEGE 07179 TaxID=945734 RepID=A0A563VYP9_9CYAN|nr:type III-B CRISPR module-associated Cmr3 family protein [Hyella patelloides]VEP16582.1 conserved hypothetical protein [Hyella patelloides LEGE 07179]
MNSKFKYAISIEPMGLLYGSSGGFLSPDNLVGRSGTKFPPDATTLSGIYAAHYGHKSDELESLQLAGNFWSYLGEENNFYVPTPFNCLVSYIPTPLDCPIKEGEIIGILQLQDNKWRLSNGETPPSGKYVKQSWLPLSQWQQLSNIKSDLVYPVDEAGNKIRVKSDPWKPLPHLHPRLDPQQRIVLEDEERGSLFLEHAIQLDPKICLIYLANIPLPEGWYRFGGEGHMVEIKSHDLSITVTNLLDRGVGNSFALISAGVFGTNRFSYRTPIEKVKQPDNSFKIEPVWNVKAAISDRPRIFRYRLGGKSGQPKRLSRGRYAVPAGSVYVLEEELPSWYKWGEDTQQQWFPLEGYSLKRWGCSLALPLTV